MRNFVIVLILGLFYLTLSFTWYPIATAIILASKWANWTNKELKKIVSNN